MSDDRELVARDLRDSATRMRSQAESYRLGLGSEGDSDYHIRLLEFSAERIDAALALLAGEPVGEMKEPITCLTCGLVFDSADDVQSIYHEWSCANIAADYDEAMAQEIGRRLYLHPPAPREVVVGYIEADELPVTGRATIHEHPNPSRVAVYKEEESDG